jgi:hypothetical protein
MGKMVIYSIYIIWKKFPRCQDYIKDLISCITTILFCIFSIIPIYYHTTNEYHLYHKKTGGTELISTVRSLHIDHFLLHSSRVLLYYIRVIFNRWYMVVLCTVKNLTSKLALLSLMTRYVVVLENYQIIVSHSVGKA